MSTFTVALVAFAVPIALVLIFTPLMFKASRREGARRAGGADPGIAKLADGTFVMAHIPSPSPPR